MVLIALISIHIATGIWQDSWGSGVPQVLLTFARRFAVYAPNNKLQTMIVGVRFLSSLRSTRLFEISYLTVILTVDQLKTNRRTTNRKETYNVRYRSENKGSKEGNEIQRSRKTSKEGG